VQFDGPGATLVIGSFAQQPTLAGFSYGDTIDLINERGHVVSVNGTLLELYSTPTSPRPSGIAHLVGTYTSGDFRVGTATVDGQFVTELTYAPCFVGGTRIATRRGDVEVQDLRVGTELRLAGGKSAPIIWIGRCEVACARHAHPESVWPVRVSAGAFAPGRPQRDLWLSPDHAVFIDGALIPIRHLQNGATVRQIPCDNVAYFHIELSRHRILLAEGLPVESYLDTGNRAAFGAAEARHGRSRVMPCAPLLSRGPRVFAARRVLHGRAVAMGHVLTAEPNIAVVAGQHRLPLLRHGKSWRVRLPLGDTPVRLRSRAWVPSEADAASQDDRRLGVAVSRLMLDGRPAALDDPRLTSGWHAPEPGWRWTDGDAGLALGGVRELAFDLAMTGNYLVAS
jgi:hypothetical protein